MRNENKDGNAIILLALCDIPMFSLGYSMCSDIYFLVIFLVFWSSVKEKGGSNCSINHPNDENSCRQNPLFWNITMFKRWWGEILYLCSLPRILNPLSHWQPCFPFLCCILSAGQASVLSTTSTRFNVGALTVSALSLLALPFPLFVFFFSFSLRCSIAVTRITFDNEDANVDQNVCILEGKDVKWKITSVKGTSWQKMSQ